MLFKGQGHERIGIQPDNMNNQTSRLSSARSISSSSSYQSWSDNFFSLKAFDDPIRQTVLFWPSAYVDQPATHHCPYLLDHVRYLHHDMRLFAKIRARSTRQAQCRYACLLTRHKNRPLTMRAQSQIHSAEDRGAPRHQPGPSLDKPQCACKECSRNLENLNLHPRTCIPKVRSAH